MYVCMYACMYGFMYVCMTNDVHVGVLWCTIELQNANIWPSMNSSTFQLNNYINRGRKIVIQ